MVIVLFPPHKFVHLPCCYYPLQDVTKYKVGLSSNDIAFIQNFMKIVQLVQNLKGE